METNKLLHLEFLRIIAIILVLFNHTGEYGFGLFKQCENSMFYGFYMFLAVACKVAVPLFWMISGALLIDKEEELKEVYCKRIFKYFIVLLLFSFIRLLYSNIKNGAGYDIVWYFKKLYMSEWATAYWYLYAYLGMLILLPIIRKMAKNMSDVEFMYLFFVTLLIRGVLPVFEYLIIGKCGVINQNFKGMFFSINIVYFLMGYFMEKRIKEEDLSNKKAVVLGIMGFLSIIITCVMTQIQINEIGEGSAGATQQFYNLLVIIPTAAVYYMARIIFCRIKIGKTGYKIMVMLASASFGVMLLENILRNELKFIVIELKDTIHTLPACFLWITAVWLSGVIITLFLKQIPVINKII